ncbi:MAG: hypothetical protein ACR2M1_12450 [Gemmatimonadaceae bacterium]
MPNTTHSRSRRLDTEAKPIPSYRPATPSATNPTKFFSALPTPLVAAPSAVQLPLADGGVVYMDQEDASHFGEMRLHRRRSDRDYVSVTIGGKNYYVYRLTP